MESKTKEKRIFYHALKDIEPLEELTVNYQFDLEQFDDQEKCRCGGKDCSKMVGLNKEQVRIYKKWKKHPECMSDWQ